MKIKLILSALLLTASFAMAQQGHVPCNFDFSATVDRGTEAGRNYYAVMSWDFSDLDVQANQVQIEVLPIEDCYNGANGAIFKPALITKIDPSNRKGTMDLNHVELRVKCFKWRTVIAGSCAQTGDWKYYSYL